MVRHPHLSCSSGGALVLLAAFAVACRARGTDAPGGDGLRAAETAEAAAAIALPVTGVPVRRADLVLTLVTSGQVRSDAVADLRAETGGTVEAVLVVPGARVERGTPLVRLDPRPFDLAVRGAEAALEEATIRATGNLASDSILLGPRQDSTRQRNAIALSGVPAAEVRLEQARLDRERATIAAPFAGVVDRIEVAAGERLAPGDQVARVVDAIHLRVEAQVLEHDLPAVRVGGTALVSTPASGAAPVRGVIAALLPMVDSATRAGRVVVRILSDDRARLQPGMYADVRLEATRLPNRVLVPARAVIERDGRPLVFVARGGRAEWVYVTPGQSNGEDTEILPDSATGVRPVGVGDTVLVEGHLTLTHDAPVRVTLLMR